VAWRTSPEQAFAAKQKIGREPPSQRVEKRAQKISLMRGTAIFAGG
jgi:hypothetical protein